MELSAAEASEVDASAADEVLSELPESAVELPEEVVPPLHAVRESAARTAVNESANLFLIDIALISFNYVNYFSVFLAMMFPAIWII